MVFVKVNAYICIQSVLYYTNMSMNIKLYALKMMNRWEVFQIFTDSLAFIDKLTEEMPETFTKKVEQFRKAYDIYDEKIVEEYRPTPRELVEAEEGLEYAIRKIYQLIRYYSDYRFDLEKETAGKALLHIFKSYGTGSYISRQNQYTKTGMIMNLLQDLAKDIPKQHIATLQLTDAVVALGTNNEVFIREQHTLNKIKSKFVPGVARKARMNAQNEYMELVELINALAVVEGEEKYAKLKLQLNTLMKKNMAKVRQRTKKKEDEPSIL